MSPVFARFFARLQQRKTPNFLWDCYYYVSEARCSRKLNLLPNITKNKVNCNSEENGGVSCFQQETPRKTPHFLASDQTKTSQLLVYFSKNQNGGVSWGVSSITSLTVHPVCIDTIVQSFHSFCNITNMSENKRFMSILQSKLHSSGPRN